VPSKSRKYIPDLLACGITIIEKMEEEIYLQANSFKMPSSILA
jgi:hypothetical protein